MDAGRRTLLILAALLSASLALAAAPRYVATRDILVEYDVSNGSAVQTAELWLSTDSGRTWRVAEATPAGGRTLRCTAPADGRYGFCLVLRNAAGESTEPPQPGTPPAFEVIVDTTPPLLQAFGAALSDGDGAPTVRLRAALIEENLGDGGVRVFYRENGEWRDGGPARPAGEHLLWTPPRGRRKLDLRIVATDLAGNRAATELSGVVVSSAAPEPAPPTTPSVAATTPPPASQPAPAPAPELTADQFRDLQRLKSLAARLALEKHYDLAAARLEDAAALAPQDAELLTTLGDALVRAGRLDDAQARYDALLRLRPDDPNALEGAALVAATQKRFPQAREALRQLQRVRPAAGDVWLRSGDVAQRLGYNREAVDAWEHVLQLPGADKDLREKARRRLEYFGPQSETTPAGPTAGAKPTPPSRPSTGDAWSKATPAAPRPLSSSLATKSTRKTAL